MCAPALIPVAMAATAAAGGVSAYSQYQQGAAQNRYYKQMAANSEIEAGYALAEGEQALKVGRQQSKAVQDTASYQGKQLKESQAEFSAAQRAIMAANGVTGVTAEDISNSTFNKQQLDEMALRYNADVKSWEVNTDASYKNQSKKYQAWQSNIQAGQYQYAGKAAKYSGQVGAFTTLLATAASVASIGAFAGAAPAGGAGAGGGGGFSSVAKLSSSPLYPCWVAAEVLADGDMMNSMVCDVRYFIVNIAPKWFKELYITYGYEFSKYVRNNKFLKYALRPIFIKFAKIGKTNGNNSTKI